MPKQLFHSKQCSSSVNYFQGQGARRRLSDVLNFILSLPCNRHILENAADVLHVTLRFACDGAKVTTKKHSVRGVVQLVGSREDIKLPSPEDEVTLFVYEGKRRM